MVAQLNDEPEAKEFLYFYLPKTPNIDFGDHIQINLAEDRIYVVKGNSRLSYRIIPSTFPNTLLWELMTERMNL